MRPQRDYPLRETFNGLRWMAHTGAPWRLIANDLPPWRVVYKQTHHWIVADCFEAIVHDLRELPRVEGGRRPQPTAAILDGRTMLSTPESGSRAGYDGAKKKNGSKIHIAGDALEHLLAVHVTPATEQSMTLAYVDQGYTGDAPADAAKVAGIALEVVKTPEAKRNFVLLPRRWVVERSIVVLFVKTVKRPLLRWIMSPCYPLF